MRKHQFLNEAAFGKPSTYSIILPIDQGVEHGPVDAFWDTEHQEMLDPVYLVDFVADLLNEGLISGTALPFRMAKMLKKKHSHADKTIVKVNHANNLNKDVAPDQTLFVSPHQVEQYAGYGYTIYPGSPNQKKMIEDFVQFRSNVDWFDKKRGKSIIWSYPRGGDFDPSSLKTIMHATYIAAQLNPDVIKVKLPEFNHPARLISDDVRQIVKCACGIPVLFSGGSKQDGDKVLEEARLIKQGGGLGMIIGRNVFQRSADDAKNLLKKIHWEFIKE